MIRFCVVPFAIALAGCAVTQPLTTKTLTDSGVSAQTAQTITGDAAALGQLMCVINGAWVAPTGANVVNATASAVAQVCAIAQPGSVPGAPPTGSVAQVVTVGNDVLALLNASKVLAAPMPAAPGKSAQAYPADGCHPSVASPNDCAWPIVLFGSTASAVTSGAFQTDDGHSVVRNVRFDGTRLIINPGQPITVVPSE